MKEYNDKLQDELDDELLEDKEFEDKELDDFYAEIDKKNSYQRYIFELDDKVYVPLTDNYEAKALFDRMSAGDEDAKNEFYHRIARYVIRFICNTCPFCTEQHYGDLFDEAWLEIMKLYKYYDPERGSPTTFLKFAIKNAIYKHLSFSNGGLSVQRAAKVRALHNAEKRLMEEFGYIPDDIAIAYEMGVRVSEVRKIRMDIEGIQSKSLDDSFENYPAADDTNPEKSVIEKETTSILEDVINGLSEQQREVICRRFGIFGYDVQTEREIADDTGIPLQNIAKIQIEAQRALRVNQKIRHLVYGGSKVYDNDDIMKDLGNECVMIVPEQASQRMMCDILDMELEDDDELFN